MVGVEHLVQFCVQEEEEELQGWVACSGFRPEKLVTRDKQLMSVCESDNAPTVPFLSSVLDGLRARVEEASLPARFVGGKRGRKKNRAVLGSGQISRVRAVKSRGSGRIG